MDNRDHTQGTDDTTLPEALWVPGIMDIAMSNQDMMLKE